MFARVMTFLLLALLLVIPAARIDAAPQPSSQHQLVKVAQVGTLGRILVTAKGFALYHWTQEKHGKIKCTGDCAKAWPPLLLPAGVSAPKFVSGVSGKFGMVMRPDKTHQLTYKGMALYTYVDDTKPGEALCQAVGGWYVLKVNGR